jgi:hypothetical protein
MGFIFRKWALAHPRSNLPALPATSRCRVAEHRRKRPRDPAQLAKLVVDIATGEVEDREPTPEERGKDPAASAMGRKGGPARAASMTPERRAEIARNAAAKRWSKAKA